MRQYPKDEQLKIRHLIADPLLKSYITNLAYDAIMFNITSFNLAPEKFADGEAAGVGLRDAVANKILMTFVQDIFNPTFEDISDE